MKTKIILLTIVLTFFGYRMYAQPCVQCEGGNNPGTNASIIGTNCLATGNSSFAGGLDSQALGNRSLAFGDSAIVYPYFANCIALGRDVTATGSSSVVIGRNLFSLATSTMIIGTGYSTSHRLENSNYNSLMVGFGSNKPTFFVGGSAGLNRTGKIGIGNVTSPQAKLHIREDENYDTASVYIQGYSENRPAYLWLGTKNFGLQKQSTSLEFLSDGDYVFSGGNLGIGTSSPDEKLEVVGNIKQANRYRIETEKIQSFSRDGLKIFTSGGTGIFIDERGQVGIAKTNPGAALDVNGKLKTVSLQIPTANPLGEPKDIAGYVLQSRDNYGNVGWVPQESLDDGDWLTTASEGLYFDSGRVGIGTDDPCSTLEVKGEITASAFYGDGSALTNTGDDLGSHVAEVNIHLDHHFLSGDGDEEGIYITDDGNVGIGTANPQAKLQVDGNVRLLSENENEQFQILANGQEPTRRGISITNDQLGSFDLYINGNQSQAAFNFIDGRLDNNTLVTIKKDGTMGIGTTQTDGYMLAVAGKIRATEVKIEHIDDWYDSVFEDDYELPSLSDIETFVKENKHLPEVPSEEEVMEQGINLGEMNAILLKKVEELTLHLIEQEKKMDEQQKQIDELRKGM